jgi:hypothetical protein
MVSRIANPAVMLRGFTMSQASKAVLRSVNVRSAVPIRVPCLPRWGISIPIWPLRAFRHAALLARFRASARRPHRLVGDENDLLCDRRGMGFFHEVVRHLKTA